MVRQIDKMGFVHRSWLRNQGYPDDYFKGRPVIGICNTWSELTPCNGHLRDFAEIVKRGVVEAGGFPLEFPVTSLGETIMRPTTMLFRNLASMDAEETIRANPIDGVVLLTGCDKTTPSTVMGACSVDLPTIVVPGGPMLNGRFRGECIGSRFIQLDDKRKKSGRKLHSRRYSGSGNWCGPQPGPLHDHGHCFYNGLHGGSIGIDITRCSCYSCC